MRLVATLFFVIYPAMMFCQVGPIEMTMDTMPVGGDEQREEMRRMQIHDELQGELTALRDSVVSVIDTIQANSALPALNSIAKDLNAILKQFSGTESSSPLYQKGQGLLNASRVRFRRVLLSLE